MNQPISSYLPTWQFYETIKASFNSQWKEPEKIEPIFKTAITATFVISSALYSVNWTLGNLPTLLLPTIFITGPITKLANDILLENGKKTIVNNIHQVSAISTYFISLFGLFYPNYSYLTYFYLFANLLLGTQNDPTLFGKMTAAVGVYTHAFHFGVLPLIQLAKNHLFNGSLPFFANNTGSISLSQAVNQTAREFHNQSSSFSWINSPINTTLTATPSNALIVSENQYSLWEKIQCFTQQDQTLIVGNTTLNQDILSTAPVSPIPLNETISSSIAPNISTSPSYALPIIGGIIATACIGYLAFRLYKAFQSQLPKTISLNERFQKINNEYNLLEIQTASATMNDPNRYLIIRYVISNVKFAKALLFNSARCVGYVALSTFFFLSIITQNGRSYLRENTTRIFTSLGGIFISLLGIGSPFLGREAYVRYTKILYPLLSETKEKLSSAQIHQLLSMQS